MPYQDGVVAVLSSQGSTVRAERQRNHWGCCGEVGSHAPGVRVPEHCRAVVAPSGKSAAVGTEGSNAQDLIAVHGDG